MTGAGTAAIDPADVERRRLDRLDSPQRIAWLRKQIGDYIVDLAARTFFRLPTWCAGHAVPDPKAEAEATCRGTAGSHGLTPIEAEMAFKAECRRPKRIQRYARANSVDPGQPLAGTILCQRHARRGSGCAEESVPQGFGQPDPAEIGGPQRRPGLDHKPHSTRTGQRDMNGTNGTNGTWHPLSEGDKRDTHL